MDTRPTYPVSYDISPPERYNRWTVAFRIILAIPHLILVGSGSWQLFSWNAGRDDSGREGFNWLFNGGVLTGVAGIVVVIVWFAILFTRRYPAWAQEFVLMVYRWTQNVHAYMLLLAAPYPPFGKGEYPLQLEVRPDVEHKRLTVAFRAILVIPHAIVLLLLGIAQAFVTLFAWFAILFTGRYPVSLWDFSVGVARWNARVAAYMWLFVDEYPPFSLHAEPQARGGGMHAQPA